MIEVLITLVPSVLWILYRCLKVLRTPAVVLTEQLHIDIPHAPTICIDSIAETSAIIHWDIETKDDEFLSYALSINNAIAFAVATTSSTSCKLNNLEKDTLYQISVIAINSLNKFRSQSLPVYLELPSKIDEILNEEKIDFMKDLMPPETERGAFQDTNLGISVAEILSIESFEVLNDLLKKSQNELQRVSSEYIAYETNVRKEAELLQSQLQEYKNEFEKEAECKVKKDNNIKDLEKQKDKLTFQKLKLTGSMKSIESSIDLFDTKLAEYQSKIKKLTDKNCYLLNNEGNEKIKIKHEIDEVSEKIRNIKLENVKLEESLKEAGLERRRLISVIEAIRPLAESFNSETTFNKDGSINPKSMELLYKIIEKAPEWQNEIVNELENHQDFESNWRNAFKFEIRKYLSIQHSLEVAKLNKDKNYQPAKMTEHQASIEFGGFSNALPKPKFRRRGNSSATPPPGAEDFAANGSWLNLYEDVYAPQAEDTHVFQGAVDPVLSQNFGFDASNTQNFNVDTNSLNSNNSFILRSQMTPQSNNRSVSQSVQSIPIFNEVMISSPASEHSVLNSQLQIFNDFNRQSPLAPAPNLWNPSVGFQSGNQSVTSLNQDLSGSRFMATAPPGNVQSPGVDLTTSHSIPNLLLNPGTNPLPNSSGSLGFANTLWSDNSLQHTRTLSGNASQIWRNDIMNSSFNLSSEFLPFDKKENNELHLH
ncbi:uncharacterized protein PRCAT00005354001 [Priceomyces carsonii]|uniref:uncharacterized protein n=1 Tax=Priceomyces carsonii TaxID=28549 RepID=UPI002ED7B6AA|nr:unnamed protein product [Priceomyces carsonii]